MSVTPGVNRKRTVTVGIGGLDSITQNPPTPVEYGRGLLASGVTSFSIATSTATATGSCDLSATPGC